MRILCLLFISLLFITATANTQHISDDYESLSGILSSDENDKKNTGLRSASDLLLGFYQNIISPQDNTSCPFHPSCSAFAREAIQINGFLSGYMLTFDRLQRCNGLPGMYQAYPLDEDREHFLDPVENYTSSD